MVGDIQKFNESGAYRACWTEGRRAGEYANVLIVESDIGNWYQDLVGIECFCQLTFMETVYGRFLHNVRVVRLSNSQITIGRSISVKDIILV